MANFTKTAESTLSAAAPTTTNALPIQLVPVEATEAEMHDINRVRDAAFGPDPLMDLCFPEDSESNSEEMLQRNLARIGKPRFMDTKAIDGDGRMLGITLWY